jgi:hypothetical protein
MPFFVSFSFSHHASTRRSTSFSFAEAWISSPAATLRSAWRRSSSISSAAEYNATRSRGSLARRLRLSAHNVAHSSGLLASDRKWARACNWASSILRERGMPSGRQGRNSGSGVESSKAACHRRRNTWSSAPARPSGNPRAPSVPSRMVGRTCYSGSDTSLTKGGSRHDHRCGPPRQYVHSILSITRGGPRHRRPPEVEPLPTRRPAWRRRE